MKTLVCSILLLLPVLSQAQKTELGLKVSGGIDNADVDVASVGPNIGASISALQNFWYVQLGLGVDVSTLSSDRWYIAPNIIANKKFALKKGYLYAGAKAGYVFQQDMMLDTSPVWPYDYSSGYLLGIQAGIVLKISKHLAFNTEMAAKRIDSWQHVKTNSNWQTEKSLLDTHIPAVYQVPLSMGLRYSL